ncbi:hypothetical protein [Micropruina sonneratiae]|nr:hypothetical protein [Micropruina sp. KQZ13P-5]MCW3157388.1 hypothetical protein [Micropruina sp. KQZ13P-5]
MARPNASRAYRVQAWAALLGWTRRLEPAPSPASLSDGFRLRAGRYHRA